MEVEVMEDLEVSLRLSPCTADDGGFLLPCGVCMQLIIINVDAISFCMLYFVHDQLQQAFMNQSSCVAVPLAVVFMINCNQLS